MMPTEPIPSLPLARLMQKTRAMSDIHLDLLPLVAKRVLDKAEDSPEKTLVGYDLRAAGWTKTLGVPDAPIHFQAFAAATRGLMESVVDALVVHTDPTGEAAKKVQRRR